MSVLERSAVARGAGPGRRMDALDGLRGVAILGVLLFHTGHLSGGFLGVDLFFALSGYLITDLLLREAAAAGPVPPVVSLVAFWGRRVRRLLPALAIMLAGVSLLVWAVGPPDLLRTTLSDGPWVQLNVVNWHLLAESAAYWDRFGSGRVFEHLWSIAVEEQFYLVWPVVVLAVAARARRRDGGAGRAGVAAVPVLVVAALASAVSLIAMVALADPADPTRVYTGTDTRAFSLLLGAAVAAARTARAARGTSGHATGGHGSGGHGSGGGGRGVKALAAGGWAGAAQAALAAGIGVMWWLADGLGSPWLFTGGLFLHSLAGALLVGLCAGAPGTPVAMALAWRPLRWLGLISYSVYLWHWPVLVLVSAWWPWLGGWGRSLAVYGVSIGLAALSKYLVEDPVRFRAGWARGRGGLVAFAAVMAVLGLLWAAVPAPAPVTIDVGGLG